MKNKNRKKRKKSKKEKNRKKNLKKRKTICFYLRIVYKMQSNGGRQVRK